MVSDISWGRRAAKCVRNLIKYMPIQHIWNLSRLLGLLIAVNFFPTTIEQRSETTRHKFCCDQLGTSHDVLKSFALRFVVKIANDYLR